MRNVDNIIEKLAKLDDFDKGNGTKKEIVRMAEKKIGLNFSPQYRYFLEKYGWIDGRGYEILGIMNNNIDVSGIVKHNLFLRLNDDFNKNWLVFHDLSEESVSFDYDRINKDGEPIIFYNMVTCQREDIAKDFVLYLEKLYEEVKDL